MCSNDRNFERLRWGRVHFFLPGRSVLMGHSRSLWPCPDFLRFARRSREAFQRFLQRQRRISQKGFDNGLVQRVFDLDPLRNDACFDKVF